MIYARYQTATPLMIGPVVKSTDGYSKLTGMTSVTLQFVYYVGTGPTSGSYATGDSSSITEIGSGLYKTWLSSNMANALGPGYIQYEIGGSSGIPFKDDYTVLSQHTYDSLIKGTGTDVLQVDVVQLKGTTVQGSSGIAQANVVKIGGASGFLTTAGIQNVSLRYIGSSASTVATGTAQLGVNVVEIKDSSFSTRSADNIEAYFYNAGSTVVSVAPTTASNVNVGALAGTTLGANVSSGYINANPNTAYTIGTGDMVLGDLYTVLRAYVISNSTYDGTTVAYYTSDGGTELWSAALTTALRTVTTN